MSGTVWNSLDIGWPSFLRTHRSPQPDCMFIKRVKLYGYLLEIEIESDFEFIVSASRLKAATEGGHEIYFQEIHVPSSIEKALDIFNLWAKKIEGGDYEPPVEEDFENDNVLAGLNDFPEIDGLTVKVGKRLSSYSDF